MSDNPQINEMVKSLREIAEKVRNMAAHEIVSVSEEWVLEKTGKKYGRTKNTHSVGHREYR